MSFRIDLVSVFWRATDSAHVVSDIQIAASLRLCLLTPCHVHDFRFFENMGAVNSVIQNCNFRKHSSSKINRASFMSSIVSHLKINVLQFTIITNWDLVIGFYHYNWINNEDSKYLVNEHIPAGTMENKFSLLLHAYLLTKGPS